jgi:putative FmdB family regulatory protein
MPTYEYKCSDCNIVFEKFQKMTDEALKVCPNCGGSVKRLIGSGAGLIFKGTGFYITDYKKNDNVKQSTSTKTTTNTSNSTTNESTSAKTETKSTEVKAAS